ncbi:MAG: hypothetical protein ACXWAT_10080 [Methylobacter sp.]
MPINDIKLIRDFHQRYKKISHTSGYALVYDALSLIREFIPCWQIGICIAKPKNEDTKNVELATVPLTVATPTMGYTQNLFYEMLNNNDFAKRYATHFMRKVIAGEPVEARSFYETDDEQAAKGLAHRFYKIVNVSDVVVIGGLIAHHKFIRSPLTQSYYAAYLSMARNNEQIFYSREKRLLELFFDIFLEDFRNKISCPENSRFMPYLTGEKIDKKPK